jgi:tRNA(fMet)-specific endonuclease VapC
MAKEHQAELRKVAWFLERMTVVLPDATFASHYGEAEAAVRRKGKPVPTMDLLIGVMAKAHGLPLLTRDSQHYMQIPGLVVETY